jgi:uncharacterized protein (TIGR03086 family)
MDLKQLDRLALASTAAFVKEVTHDDLDRPTPCEGWDVRALLDHVVGGNHLYADAVHGSVDWSTRDDGWVADDPHGAFERSADQLTEALAPLDLTTSTIHLPFGVLPAGQAVAIHFVDQLTHGWDLAVATGQDPALDADLAQAALAIVASYPASSWGEGGFFARQVPVDPSAPAHVRLVAMLGREPDRPTAG